MDVRPEQPGDVPGIRQVNLAAFEGPAEADIVDALRANCSGLVSLVAVDEGEVIGHALFSPAVISGAGGDLAGMGLAPVAVTPGRQRQGVGTALIEAGIALVRGKRCPFVIVLGHPGYYPRFGFKPAAEYGVRSEWDVPPEAFMVLVLDEQVAAHGGGVARYRPEFASAL